MGKCRHQRHEVDPQHNVWKGGRFMRVVAAQVFCADCKVWLYQKPVNPDLAPLNSVERREARIDDSSPSTRTP
jgi:uncharacterized protein (DUF169 family)